jgi:hypothetical protein
MKPLMTIPSLDLPFAGADVAFADNRGRMSLPTANGPWPPAHFNPVNYDLRLWDAWWSGDPDKLMRALRLLLDRRELPAGPPVLRDHG